MGRPGGAQRVSSPSCLGGSASPGAGATLPLIPEEFQGQKVRFRAIVDTLVGAILKRLSYGRRDGVA